MTIGIGATLIAGRPAGLLPLLFHTDPYEAGVRLKALGYPIPALNPSDPDNLSHQTILSAQVGDTYHETIFWPSITSLSSLNGPIR